MGLRWGTESTNAAAALERRGLVAADPSELTPGLVREQWLPAIWEDLAPHRLVAVHFHPNFQTKVADEPGLVAQELGLDLAFAQYGMLLNV